MIGIQLERENAAEQDAATVAAQARPAPRESLSTRAYDELRERLRRGQVAPDDRLVDTEIARELVVSRSRCARCCGPDDMGVMNPSALTRIDCLPGLAPGAGYPRSALHADNRIWVEKNCYVDIWIEVLHALQCQVFESGAGPGQRRACRRPGCILQ